MTGATDAAFARLVQEILDGAPGIDAHTLVAGPERALQASLEQISRDRTRTFRAEEELRALKASRSWKVAQALRRIRRFLAPPGSLRARLGRRAMRFVKAVGGNSIVLDNGAAALPTVVPALETSATAQQIQELRSRCDGRRELFLFLPSIPWNIPLFQRPQHLARQLAKDGHLVIYDCSGTGEDLTGLREIEPGLFLFAGEPCLLATLPDPVLWTFTYNFPMRKLYPRGSRVVYDWIDDLTVFPFDQELLRRNHEQALQDATVVASVARRLHVAASSSRPDALYLPNAVEYDRFADPTAQAPADPVLARLRAEGKPIAGYYGALAAWFDYALLEAVASRRPDWNFLLIGPDYDGSIPGHALLRRPNVHWIGSRPYPELPGYLRAMTCTMIPFLINDITLATSPLKLYEYLAAGKPVLTTPMPECLVYPEVHIGHGADDFANALDVARTQADDPVAIEKFRAVGRANSWGVRTRIVLQCLQQIRNREFSEAS